MTVCFICVILVIANVIIRCTVFLFSCALSLNFADSVSVGLLAAQPMLVVLAIALTVSHL